MKRIYIKGAIEALRPVKLHKITDAGIRTALTEDYLRLVAAGRKLDDEIKDAREVFLGPYKEEEREVEDLRSRMLTSSDPAEQKALAREINSHTDYFAAQRTFAAEQDKILQVEVEGLNGIDRDRFLKALEKEEITFGQLEALSPLFDIEN